MAVKGVAEFKRKIDEGRYENLLHAERAIGRWPQPSKRRKQEVLAYAKKVLKDTRPEKTKKKKPKASRVSPGDRVRYVQALLRLKDQCQQPFEDLLESALRQKIDIGEMYRDWRIVTDTTDPHLPLPLNQPET